MLDTLAYGAWLAEMVLEVAGYLFMVTLPLLGLVVVSWMSVKPGEKDRFRRGWNALAVQGAAVILLLGIGSLCHWTAGGRNDTGAEGVSMLVVFGALVAGVILAVRSGGRWFLVLASSLFGFWITVLTGFVVGMSITGDWL